jgi:hypothetical protein
LFSTDPKTDPKQKHSRPPVRNIPLLLKPSSNSDEGRRKQSLRNHALLRGRKWCR